VGWGCFANSLKLSFPRVVETDEARTKYAGDGQPMDSRAFGGTFASSIYVQKCNG
jgi:hypothetical protein